MHYALHVLDASETRSSGQLQRCICEKLWVPSEGNPTLVQLSPGFVYHISTGSVQYPHRQSIRHRVDVRPVRVVGLPAIQMLPYNLKHVLPCRQGFLSRLRIVHVLIKDRVVVASLRKWFPRLSQSSTWSVSQGLDIIVRRTSAGVPWYSIPHKTIRGMNKSISRMKSTGIEYPP